MTNFNGLNNTQRRTCIANQLEEVKTRLSDYQRYVNTCLDRLASIANTISIVEEELQDVHDNLEREYSIVDELKRELVSIPVQQDAVYTIRRGLTPASPAAVQTARAEQQGAPVNANIVTRDGRIIRGENRAQSQPEPSTVVTRNGRVINTANLTGQQIANAVTGTMRLRTPDGRELLAQFDEDSNGANANIVAPIDRESIDDVINDVDDDEDLEWEDMNINGNETTMSYITSRTYRCDNCGTYVTVAEGNDDTDIDECPGCSFTVRAL